jgi:hypothetical protein
LGNIPSHELAILVVADDNDLIPYLESDALRAEKARLTSLEIDDLSSSG